MKVRKKERIPSIHVEPNDVVELTYTQIKQGDGEVTTTTRKVLSEEIGRSMELDTAVIFDVEKGDFGKNVKDGIGGAFLQTKRT